MAGDGRGEVSIYSCPGWMLSQEWVVFVTVRACGNGHGLVPVYYGKCGEQRLALDVFADGAAGQQDDGEYERDCFHIIPP